MHYRDYEYRHALSILNANHRLRREIETVLAHLDLDLPRPYARKEAASPHHQIQRAFVRRGWQPEVLVSPRTAKRHYFDLFKERVAIEIELSNRELLYRDYMRFQVAEADGRLDVGIILLLDDDARYLHPWGLRNGLPRLEDVVDDLTVLYPTIGVPIWVVALGA
jgi:hypothetical protein